MSCQNKISFENLVKIPLGLKYKKNTENLSMVANTENLNISLEPYNTDSKTEAIICDKAQQLNIKIKLMEIRLSGYLVYSVMADAIDKSENFHISPKLGTTVVTQGWASESAVLPIVQDKNQSYIVIGYVQDEKLKAEDIKVNIYVNDVHVDQVIKYGDNVDLLLKGELEIKLA